MLSTGSAEAEFAVSVVVSDTETAARCHPARDLHPTLVILQIETIERPFVEVGAAEGTRGRELRAARGSERESCSGPVRQRRRIDDLVFRVRRNRRIKLRRAFE